MAGSVGSMSAYGTSSERIDPFCDPCWKDDTIRPVAGYCPTCVEFYCQNCLVAHRRMAATERHKILLGPDLPSCQADKPLKYQLCEKHDGEGKDRYCFYHSITICGICYITDHKQCQVKEVSYACKSFNMPAEKKAFSADVGILLKHLEETSQSIESNKARLEKKKHDFLTEAQKKRDDLLEKVRQSYQDFSGEVTSLFKDHTSTLALHQSALDEIKTKVDAILQGLQQRDPKKQNDLRDFLDLHDSAEKVRFCENKIKLLNFKHIVIDCTLNTNIQPLILRKNMLGELSLQTETFKYSTELSSIHYPFTGSCQGPQNTFPGLTAMGKMGKNAVQSVKLTPLDKINVRIPADKKNCSILGVEITIDGNMLLLDHNNCKIKLFSPDKTLLSYLEPPEGPVDVAVINKSEAAISMDGKKIGIIEIADSSRLSMTRIIKLDWYVRGITNYNNNLIIICCESRKSPRSAQMIDINGKILWTTTTDSQGKILFERARFLTTCFGDDFDTVIVTDRQKQTITVLDAGTGKVVKICDVEGKVPRGVTVDDNGSVYVCYQSGEITVWSRGMQEETRLTTKNKYLMFPCAMAYNSRRSELVVTSTATDNDLLDLIHRFKISAI